MPAEKQLTPVIPCALQMQC